MTNNSINNTYYYQKIFTDRWRPNINNWYVSTTTHNYYLPSSAEKGDIILVPLRVTTTTNINIIQNNGQKIIVPFNQTSYAIKTITTPGPTGHFNINMKGITEIILVCIEKDTTFLMLNFDGFGFNGTIV
jgi:hypothetical protein